jgi:hypothetical protein
MLFLWRKFTAKKRLLIAGDVGLLYFVWYGVERSALETFRSGWNWTFFGLATAQLVGLGAAVAAIVAIVIRHLWVRHHRGSDSPDEGPVEKSATEPIEPTTGAGAEPVPAAASGGTEAATGSDSGDPART